jgi:catechol 2,3-dioxygenase-like lactoylglutathione lyase family enzyme
VSEVSFKKVGAVILLVSNMDSSIKFYRDTLGLVVKNISDEWTEFFTSGTVLALHPAKTKVKHNPNMLVGFMVSDLDSIANTLRSKNIKFFKEPKEESFGKHAIIEDPDGHLISIAEIKSKSSEGFDLIGLIGAE